jgi:hypothetical protein
VGQLVGRITNDTVLMSASSVKGVGSLLMQSMLNAFATSYTRVYMLISVATTQCVGLTSCCAAAVCCTCRNLFTPRPSERGISEQRPPTVPEEGSMVSPPRTERPGRSRTGTPRGTQPSSEAAVAAQAPAVAGAAGAAAGSSTANQQRNESADGSADVTVSSGGGTEAAKGADVPAGCASAAASAAAALPSTASAKAAKLQPRGLGLSAGLIKGPAGLGLSPEPSDLRIESSKVCVKA